MRTHKNVRVEGEVRIDPKLIPASEYQTACRVLNASIRLALSDPAKRAEFEEWKRRKQLKPGGE